MKGNLKPMRQKLLTLILLTPIVVQIIIYMSEIVDFNYILDIYLFN